jgi:hypothetical protein
MDYGMFSGDGRIKLNPTTSAFGLVSRTVTRAQARTLIDLFEQFGHSTHSSSGSTVWVLMEHAVHHKIPLDITWVTGFGYYIKKRAPA